VSVAPTSSATSYTSISSIATTRRETYEAKVARAEEDFDEYPIHLADSLAGMTVSIAFTSKRGHPETHVCAPSEESERGVEAWER
jgi:hypothetical protein